ncbi:hypothetical protein ABXN37_06825 [Piscinibacter sakaiensis]|uniref:Putative GTPase n=1 Tax=Piscinibacter sakaiensis TaxID=1547922 RepID=A0A0K8NWW7_PISS1|nr:hypothetical protein [Piscinibacter sakaiensis]GAP34868.1 putative GTPase [Piscinibacter sakaiensis]
MFRCPAPALLLALAALVALPAAAQVQRPFPAQALRGEIVVTSPPEITLNGAPARLAPGARIRGEDNMLRLSASLVGQPLRVNYTLDTYGLVRDVWILRPEEQRMRPWPRTPAEAAAWQFDAQTQTWSKP